MAYVRTYQSRPCVKCGETIDAPKGPQRYCEPCRGTCEVPGCTNVVRAGGRCTTHYRQKFAVPAYAPINGRCGVQGCGRELKQKGLCALHYGRVYHTGSIGDAQPRTTHAVGVACKVDGCEKPARGQGYCITHYRRLRTKGEVGGAELLRRTQGEGYVDEAGYRVIAVNGGHEYEHRYVMSRVLGRPLTRAENVHHRNGDRTDNSPTNLELWSTQQPAGQRVADKIEFAKALLTKHGVSHEAYSPSDFVMGVMAMGA